MLAALVEQERAAGRLAAALSWADCLAGEASGPRPAGAVLLRGEILARLERDTEADADYRAARQLAVASGPRSVLWRVAAARAQLWRYRDSAIFTREAATARAEILELAETIDDEARRATFLAASAVRP